MATTKKTTVKKAVTAKKVAPAEKSEGSVAKNAVYIKDVSSVIVRPRITEKATKVAEGNVYTFDITPNASKTQVKEAIVKLYKVTPLKVNVMKIRARKVFVRGKRGVTAGGRKAYVFLKKGDKIELM
jgi:large subunit ribosomal protein L23